VVQCILYNTSYQADFSFINGEQTVAITKAETPYNTVIPYNFLEWDSNNAIFSNYFANGNIIPNSWNTTIVQALSYQAVMESLGRVLVSLVYNSWPAGAIAYNSTSVMSTVLTEAQELAWLESWPFPSSFTGPSTFKQLSDQNPGRYWNGVDTVDSTQSTMPFKELLENLFLNIVISLMGSELLQ
jgi:hypothetical protein